MAAASAQTTIATLAEQEKDQRTAGPQQTAHRFSQSETAIQGTTNRQEKLERTAQAIVTLLDNVLPKIDKIQMAQSQTLTDHERALLARQEQQKGLAETAAKAKQQQQQNAAETQFVHGRVTTTEGQLGQAEQAHKVMLDRQGKVQEDAVARKTAHEMETAALKQQVQKLMEEQKITLDLARLTHGQNPAGFHRPEEAPTRPPMMERKLPA